MIVPEAAKRDIDQCTGQVILLWSVLFAPSPFPQFPKFPANTAPSGVRGFVPKASGLVSEKFAEVLPTTSRDEL